ncbi:recombinase [Enterococcus faecium]|nr:recombinase [Enterococcus faecium]
MNNTIGIQKGGCLMKEVEVIKARSSSSNSVRGKMIEQLRVAAYCRVSTDSEDQLNSYNSQKAYYTDLIQKNGEWIFAGIYADEAITGTQVTKREDYQRMINDCMNGEIDMLITKSISRFARNTLDTLKYVRMLKEKNIAVYFEDEKINTLTMDGELLLVVLSSVAQQEVENISANVKKGLKMKMKRGELVGFQGCLGYDYHPEDKSITVNEEEAEIVRYIFNRYIEGAGGSVIGQELENLGHLTKYGNSTWVPTTVLGIIKNEKYKGDILLGKTFTVDPISKRRLENMGEEDQFYIRNHHEPIVSEEVFDKAQEILNRRSKNRGKIGDGNSKREKYSRKYAFSCLLECGFCGGTLTRRRWHSGTEYNKVIWQCVTSTKKGKKHCPHSKGIPETAIEEAFVESYRLLCDNNKDVLEEFLKRIDETLSSSSVNNKLLKVDKDIEAIEKKKSKLVDMRLEDIIDSDTYESKFSSMTTKQEDLITERIQLQETATNEKDIKRRLRDFKKTLEQNEVLNEFDRYVFESMVEKVVVGGYDEDGNIDPAQLVFVYKTGFKNSLDGNRFKPERKNARANRKPKNLYSHTNDENQSLCSDTKADTRWRMKHRSKFDNKDWRSESLIMSADLIPLERQRN